MQMTITGQVNESISKVQGMYSTLVNAALMEVRVLHSYEVDAPPQLADACYLLAGVNVVRQMAAE